ncbi:DUF1127 domain-containing protein [Pseudoroseicyclus aestuarii]|uniref:Uncharacterized protein YjiS (DUF1127 family) n=1 Tax=Pseudoroseicyclus aestuarii TaxID=1795041 RepID=A0A318T0D5_9RHOB|nr:DUF1127 domain-containing protein [Pseudoroseicyclus aestuarii]PYE86079.1 uncharacterized protein YjiS (DUF1127 family) [Pseudoroseicyclus aestuarii]
MRPAISLPDAPHRRATHKPLAVLLARWRERARSRRQLSLLEPHLMRDIGIDHVEMRGEALKPFWRS